MRYADVLLMHAKVLNDTEETALAIPFINQVRTTHGDMPAMIGYAKSEVSAQIEHERIMEFTLEG